MMQPGDRRLVIGAVVVVCGVLAAIPFVSAQTRDRDVRADVLRPFGAGSEIGVSVRELTDDEVSKTELERAGGVYVQNIQDGGPAARADVRNGDIIIGVDGERVRGVRHFVRLISESPAGRSVRMDILRNNARRMVDITPETGRVAQFLPEFRDEIERGLRTLPRDFDFEWPVAPGTGRRLGISMTPLTDQLAAYFGVTEGVLISAVEERSPAASAGLHAGDVITAIDGRTVRAPVDVGVAARRPAPGAVLDFRVVRDRKALSVKVTVPESETIGPRQIPI
jgi:serine protease Do